MQFEEKQKFTQWWLWVILIGVTLIPTYGIYQQLVLQQPFGDNPIPTYGLVGLLIFMLAILIFFWKIELKTIIDTEAIRIKFFPFVNKEIKWEIIKETQLIDYGFVGGWGIRISTKYGTIYNTTGTKGLAITLKNGKQYCIGTQKETELKQMLTHLMT